MKNNTPILSEQELLLVMNKTVGLFIEHNIINTADMADYLHLMAKQLDPEPTPKGNGRTLYNIPAPL